MLKVFCPFYISHQPSAYSSPSLPSLCRLLPTFLPYPLPLAASLDVSGGVFKSKPCPCPSPAACHGRCTPSVKADANVVDVTTDALPAPYPVLDAGPYPGPFPFALGNTSSALLNVPTEGQQPSHVCRECVCASERLTVRRCIRSGGSNRSCSWTVEMSWCWRLRRIR